MDTDYITNANIEDYREDDDDEDFIWSNWLFLFNKNKKKRNDLFKESII